MTRSRAGRSIGEVGATKGWPVAGTNGEDTIVTAAPTQAGAWWLGCEQVSKAGKLEPVVRARGT